MARLSLGALSIAGALVLSSDVDYLRGIPTQVKKGTCNVLLFYSTSRVEERSSTKAAQNLKIQALQEIPKVTITTRGDFSGLPATSIPTTKNKFVSHSSTKITCHVTVNFGKLPPLFPLSFHLSAQLNFGIFVIGARIQHQ
jgi:hypothetical protein